MFFNNFDRIANSYQATDLKPDKQFSILPTVIKLAGNVGGKTVLDLGCGSGFFTFPIAECGAANVIGVDSSAEQLVIARNKAVANTEFHLCDVFADELPMADVIVAPFVANYATSVSELRHFWWRVYESLNEGGKAIFVVDLPSNSCSHKQRKKWGAVKWWSGNRYTDGAKIQNHLYNARGKFVCTLWAHYFSESTIQFSLQDAGFWDIRWHKPVISDEGIRLFGAEFWNGYCDNSELGYITAQKLFLPKGSAHVV